MNGLDNWQDEILHRCVELALSVCMNTLISATIRAEDTKFGMIIFILLLYTLRGKVRLVCKYLI